MTADGELTNWAALIGLPKTRCGRSYMRPPTNATMSAARQYQTLLACPESAAKHDAMLKLARSEAPIPISPDALDKHPWILNCPNGKIDLRSGKLCEHRREDYITKLCPVVYQPDAGCPTWLACWTRSSPAIRS